ncbi:MAG: hypothetical protein KIT72_08545 [Polyangiaceae bacterium]|nr:hypothetical protein [Polyangiaceae bacterium]
MSASAPVVPAPALALSPPGDHAAFMAAAQRGKSKLARLGHGAVVAQLSPTERAEIARACAAQLPRFESRVAMSTMQSVGAPFWRRTRILHLVSAMPFPAQEAYATWTSSGPVILSGNPNAYSVICADESPMHTDDPDVAVLLAIFAGMWSSASLHKEVRLSTVDDIPWRRATPRDHAAEAQVRATYGSQIAPTGLAKLNDGVRVTMWVASESWLRHRVAEVQHDSVQVVETPVIELPIFPGRLWGEQDGRFVPIG